jgi:hypothetical protein
MEMTGIEDLKSRPGLDAFYFLHTKDANPASMPTREELWSQNEDVLLRWITFQLSKPLDVVSGSRNDGWYVLPKRLDLISKGYEG